MKGIITLLIFVCFFHSGVLARQNTPKAVMQSKEKGATDKKQSVKKEVSPQKKKTNKSLPGKEKAATSVHAKKKDPVNLEHEKEESKVTPVDSGKAPDDVVVVSDTPLIMPPRQEDAVVQPAKVVFPTTPVDKPMKDWHFWILYLSPVLIFGMGIYVFLTNAKIFERLHRIQKHLDAQKSDQLWEKAKSQATLNTADVERLINSNPTLKKIQEECITIKSNMEKLEQPAPKIVAPALVEEPMGGTFYMTGPTNNYFPSSARSNQRENTVYKFILQPGGNEARFELHTTGASINEIIKVIESYIKPACDEENLPSSNIRNIVTRKQGIAILDNEKWIIKDKAVIRYE